MSEKVYYVNLPPSAATRMCGQAGVRQAFGSRATPHPWHANVLLCNTSRYDLVTTRYEKVTPLQPRADLRAVGMSFWHFCPYP